MFRTTSHARKRFIQRFGLNFHKSYFYHNELTDNLIFALIKNSIEYDWWKTVPFYKNKIESISGPIDVYYCSKPVDMYFIVTRDTKVIKTVVPRFDPEHIKHKE